MAFRFFGRFWCVKEMNFPITRLESLERRVSALENDLGVSPQDALDVDGAGWIPLNKAVAKSKGNRPAEVRFPDRTKAHVKEWSDVLVSVTEWLVNNKRLTAKMCPVTAPRAHTRHIINTENRHRAGHAFHSLRVIDEQFFVEIAVDAPGILRNTRHVIKHCQQGVSRFSIRMNKEE